MTKTAFIGLGVMGGPMAGHLAKAGHQVTVYNRTAKKAENWVKEHVGESAPTPAQAADGAEIVCACVGNDADLRSVVYGDDGILSGMKKGAIFVDHTTVSATVAREIDAKARGPYPAARRGRKAANSRSWSAVKGRTSTPPSRSSAPMPRR